MDGLSGDVRTNDEGLVVLPSAGARAYILFALCIPTGMLSVIAATTTQSVLPAIVVIASALVFTLRATVRPKLLIYGDDAVIVNAIRTWRLQLQDVEAVGWRYTLCLAEKLRHGPPAIVFARRSKPLAPPAHATALLSEEKRRVLVAEVGSRMRQRGIAVTVRPEDLKDP